ncbi:hypothetical protein PT974_12418 [Cladobotryum mycophilum]|uniref:GDP/GTP exchange factor Sec2 N-terminal domain-containing protein n=1 Tax=Cladobotryum mycophilum TaxID=491253 RepID=A0ABR0S8W5_9HYPO
MSSNFSLRARTTAADPADGLDNVPVLMMTTTPRTGKSSTSSVSSQMTHTTMSLDPAPEFRNDTQSNSPIHSGTARCARCQDSGLHHIDKLVEDLINSENELESERRKHAQKDAEMAKLEQDLAERSSDLVESQHQRGAAETRVRELEQMASVQAGQGKEVDELRRLLAFHVKNGEQLSRQFKDMQAANKHLEASLQQKEAALQEQASLLAGLGVRSNGGGPPEALPQNKQASSKA